MSLIFIYNIVHRCFERWTDLLMETRTKNGNPILYVRILESTAYANFTFSILYAQTFKGQQMLNFINKLQLYSEKYVSQEFTGFVKIVSLSKLFIIT